MDWTCLFCVAGGTPGPGGVDASISCAIRGEQVQPRVAAPVSAFDGGCETLIPCLGNDALPDIDGDPAGLEEQALAVFRHPPGASEERDLLLEAGGHRHLAQMVPEVGIVALGRMVMEDEEVADPVIFEVG